MLEHKVSLDEAEPVKRAQTGEPVSADLVPALDQCVGEILLGFRIAELARFDDGANLGIAETHHDLRCPIRVLICRIQESGVWILRLPGLWFEGRRLKSPDRWIVRILHTDPVFVPDSKRCDALERRSRFPYVFVSGSRLLRAHASTAKRRSEVDEVMLHITSSGLADEHIQGVDCA